MKKLALMTLVLLSGCYDSTNELSVYIQQVKATTTSQIDPMPEVHPFNHYDYSAFDLRSPFSLPKPDVIQQKIQQMSGCLSPDPRRRKQPLEKFALGDLTMRGTMGDDGILWALVEASDFTLHRVAIGSYMGLFNGHIVEVNAKNVKLVELTPDGAGCWVERETVIKIALSQSEG
ncbi:MAG: pilus assembly protein PilP [Colwellia sp.]|nr:pilus assembly protein PilP [Colwellia sp.]